eukprot:2153369-Rhodomonas_salina.1
MAPHAPSRPDNVKPGAQMQSETFADPGVDEVWFGQEMHGALPTKSLYWSAAQNAQMPPAPLVYPPTHSQRAPDVEPAAACVCGGQALQLPLSREASLNESAGHGAHAPPTDVAPAAHRHASEELEPASDVAYRSHANVTLSKQKCASGHARHELDTITVLRFLRLLEEIDCTPPRYTSTDSITVCGRLAQGSAWAVTQLRDLPARRVPCVYDTPCVSLGCPLDNKAHPPVHRGYHHLHLSIDTVRLLRGAADLRLQRKRTLSAHAALAVVAVFAEDAYLAPRQVTIQPRGTRALRSPLWRGLMLAARDLLHPVAPEAARAQRAHCVIGCVARCLLESAAGTRRAAQGNIPPRAELPSRAHRQHPRADLAQHAW